MTDSKVVISKISELKERDRVLSGSLLGPVSAAQTLTVRSIKEAESDKYAVTFNNVGTLFLHRDQMVEVLPWRPAETNGSQ